MEFFFLCWWFLLISSLFLVWRGIESKVFIFLLVVLIVVLVALEVLVVCCVSLLLKLCIARDGHEKFCKLGNGADFVYIYHIHIGTACVFVSYVLILLQKGTCTRVIFIRTENVRVCSNHLSSRSFCVPVRKRSAQFSWKNTEQEIPGVTVTDAGSFVCCGGASISI